ncbi:MAG: HD domain-containing protein [Firmicutes bacterium]|nr:HD domain-containing protein [Bacillota bacterium]
MRDEIKNVCDFYAITHRLKNTLRSGWTTCGVPAKRIESVAEHIYSAQMLALIIHSEFKLGLDISRSALLIAIHELGECIIGDLPATGSPVSKQEKQKMEMDAICDILKDIHNPQFIKDLYIEFDEQKTAEAKFAFLIDKLECDFQCKFYQEQGLLEFNKLKPNTAQLDRIQRRKSQGYTKFSDFWIDSDIDQFFADDKIFKAIAKYLKNNNIF